MSNVYQEAADAIKRIAKLNEAYTLAAEVLDQAGSFTQAAEEAKKATDSAKAELDQITAELAKAKDAVKDAAKSTAAKINKAAGKL